MNSEFKVFGPYDHIKVMNFLPHRYPFAFVDKIKEVRVPMVDGTLQAVGTRVIGQKNATINENYFTGHFPTVPITPGVIILETMAQVASFCLVPWVKVDEQLHVEGKFEIRLAGIDNARFRRPFIPGDCMMITCDLVKQRKSLWGFHCKAEVDGAAVAECDILASLDIEVIP